MTRGPRIQVSISLEAYKDIKGRAGFNFSRFVEQKYREEFLNEEGLKAKIEYHKDEMLRHQDRLTGIKEEKIVTPKFDSKKCPVCSMFFHEDIAIRKKTHIYKHIYVCALCSQEQMEHVDKMVQELKARELEEENEKENQDSAVQG